MSEQNIQVIVEGALVEGATAAEVKSRIAQLFKTSVDKIEPMFSGKPFAVKRELDLETARKYQAALLQAGLMAKLVAAAPSSALQNASLAATGSDIDTPPPRPPSILIPVPSPCLMRALLSWNTPLLRLQRSIPAVCR